MDIVAQKKKNNKRYLPHTVGTKEGAVKLYRKEKCSGGIIYIYIHTSQKSILCILAKSVHASSYNMYVYYKNFGFVEHWAKTQKSDFLKCSGNIVKTPEPSRFRG